jgi:ABC-type transport system involved in cytochrome c biogenesis permease subunit
LELVLTLIFSGSAVSYCCSAAIYMHQLANHEDGNAALRRLTLLIGLVLHTLLIGASLALYGGAVLGGLNLLLCASWLVAFAYAIFEMASGIKDFGAYIVPVVMAAFVAAWLSNLLTSTEAATMITQGVFERWPVLVVHVAAFMASAICFLVSGIASIIFLRKSSLLKARKTEALGTDSRLSLPLLRRVARRSVLIGLPLLTLGLLLGLSYGLVSGSLVSAQADASQPFFSLRIILSTALWLWYVFYLASVYLIKSTSHTCAIVAVIGAGLTLIVAVASSTLPMLNG